MGGAATAWGRAWITGGTATAPGRRHVLPYPYPYPAGGTGGTAPCTGGNVRQQRQRQTGGNRGGNPAGKGHEGLRADSGRLGLFNFH